MAKMKKKVKVSVLDKWKKFAHHYVQTYKVAESARFAGYSETSAKQTGSHILSNPNFQPVLEEAKKKHFAELGVTKERVIEEIANIAFANAYDYMTYDEAGNLVYKDPKTLTRAQQSAVAKIQITSKVSQDRVVAQDLTIQLSKKSEALDKLARHLGLYEKDNLQQQGVISVGIAKEDEPKLPNKLPVSTSPEDEPEDQAEDVDYEDLTPPE